MQSKGVEYPAYLPQTNPGYPWALAGGHMSMRTFLLYVVERETDVDYWIDAITNRGPTYLLDDITGIWGDRSFSYYPQQTLTVDVADTDHSITEGLASWEMVDETYVVAEPDYRSQWWIG